MIIAITLIAIIIIAVIAIISLRKPLTDQVGVLMVNDSDGEPYIFLELTTDISVLKSNKYIILEVKHIK